MSLTDWPANRWIVAHEPSVGEIADLFAVIDRDLGDAAVPRLSEDWRLGIACNAALAERTLGPQGVGRGPPKRWRAGAAMLTFRLSATRVPRLSQMP